MRTYGWLVHHDPNVVQSPIFRVHNNAVRLTAFLVDPATEVVLYVSVDGTGNPDPANWVPFVRGGRRIVLSLATDTQLVLTTSGYYKVELVSPVRGEMVWFEEEEASVDRRVVPVHFDAVSCGGGGPVTLPAPRLVTCQELRDLAASQSLDPGQWYGLTDVTPVIETGQIVYVQAIARDRIPASGWVWLPTLIGGANQIASARLWPVELNQKFCSLERVHDTLGNNIVEGYAAINTFPWNYNAIGSSYNNVYVRNALISDAGNSSVVDTTFVSGTYWLSETEIEGSVFNTSSAQMENAAFFFCSFHGAILFRPDRSFVTFEEVDIESSFVTLTAVDTFSAVRVKSSFVDINTGGFSSLVVENNSSLVAADARVRNVTLTNGTQAFFRAVGINVNGESFGIYGSNAFINLNGSGPQAHTLSVRGLTVQDARFEFVDPDDEEAAPRIDEVSCTSGAQVLFRMTSALWRVSFSDSAIVQVNATQPLETGTGAHFSRSRFSGGTLTFEWRSAHNSFVDESSFDNAYVIWRQRPTKFLNIDISSGAAIYDLAPFGTIRLGAVGVYLTRLQMTTGSTLVFAPSGAAIGNLEALTVENSGIRDQALYYLIGANTAPRYVYGMHLASNGAIYDYGGQTFSAIYNSTVVQGYMRLIASQGHFIVSSVNVESGYLIFQNDAGTGLVQTCTIRGWLRLTNSGATSFRVVGVVTQLSYTYVSVTVPVSTPATNFVQFAGSSFAHSGLAHNFTLTNPGGIVVVDGLRSHGRSATTVNRTFTTNTTGPLFVNY